LREHGKGARGGGRTGEPVLRVESPLAVFGRTLTIARDPEGTHPTALELFPGTMAYLKAPSGVGKTTLMKMLVGLIRGERFRMRLGRTAVSERTEERLWRREIWANG